MLQIYVHCDANTASNKRFDLLWHYFLSSPKLLCDRSSSAGRHVVACWILFLANCVLLDDDWYTVNWALLLLPFVFFYLLIILYHNHKVRDGRNLYSSTVLVKSRIKLVKRRQICYYQTTSDCSTNQIKLTPSTWIGKSFFVLILCDVGITSKCWSRIYFFSCWG